MQTIELLTQIQFVAMLAYSVWAFWNHWEALISWLH